jgi:hypothetical protein
MGGELTESRFDPMTFDFDTMLNYQLSQKLKLIRRGKFNHLTITLTISNGICVVEWSGGIENIGEEDDRANKLIVIFS